LEVTFGSRITYIEYTSGGREALRRVIRKIAESRYRAKTVLVVGLEDLPRRKTDPVGIKSNKQVALEIAAKYGVELQVFTLTNLTELEERCMKGKLSYSQ